MQPEIFFETNIIQVFLLYFIFCLLFYESNAETVIYYISGTGINPRYV